MMRQNPRTRLGRRLRIEAVREAEEVEEVQEDGVDLGAGVAEVAVEGSRYCGEEEEWTGLMKEPILLSYPCSGYYYIWLHVKAWGNWGLLAFVDNKTNRIDTFVASSI